MTAGRVCVNGQVVTELGAKVDPLKDVVTVDGREVQLQDAPVTLMLYKPAGYISTMHDPHGRPTVAELVPTAQYPGLFCVGRLDTDTTGLLLFSTNGELGDKLLHPRYEHEKHYVARVQGTPTAAELAALEMGVDLEDGRTAPAKAQVLAASDARVTPVRAQGGRGGRGARGVSYVALTLHEGKKHQVKRMLEAVGHPVEQLHRDGFCGVWLENITPGTWRELTQDELARLERVGAREA
jgi:23S rRNA pseudouridine2605 synthase